MKIHVVRAHYNVLTIDFIDHHFRTVHTSEIPDDEKKDLMLSDTNSAQKAINVAEHNKMVRLLSLDHIGTLCS